jgi:hypothetical protein
MADLIAADRVRIGGIIDDLRQANTDATEAFEAAILGHGDPVYDTVENAAWYIENAFLKLVIAAEVFDLVDIKRLILEDIREASTKKYGFADSTMGPDEPRSIWLARYRQFLHAFETIGGSEQENSVTKDVTEIIRATAYPITDKQLFGTVPASEDEVHRRIEGVLRCVFPDLKHKPVLTKPIKNFEPDTGLPSIRTLIEYKFVRRSADVPVIADQILADTRGYVSRDWATFLYVIYETRRFRPEHEWNALLRDCGATSSTTAIVLSGEAPLTRTRGGTRGGRVR